MIYNLENLHKIELDMLEQFINICNKENLQYYVLGGTMLGTVRHKGFIPWDDDIDVAMPRKDYEKFLNIAQKYLSKNLFLQTYITDKEAPWNYAKIRNSETTFIEKSIKHLNINHGCFIDVFPLDYCSTNKIKKSVFNFYNYILRLRIRFDKPNANLPIYKKIIRKIISITLKFIYPNITCAMQKRDSLFKSVKESSLLANYCGFWGEREIVPTNWYGKGIDMEFENLTVKVPNHYDKWLTQVYGDYMKLPPKEKQVSNHYANINIIDLENSYTKYIKRSK